MSRALPRKRSRALKPRLDVLQLVTDHGGAEALAEEVDPVFSPFIEERPGSARQARTTDDLGRVLRRVEKIQPR